MLKVDAEEYLGESGRDLHVLISEAEPQLPPLPVHLGEAVPRCIHQEALLIVDMMEMQELSGACSLSHSGHPLPSLLATGVEDLIDEGGLASVGSAHKEYLFFLEEGRLVVLDLLFQKFRQSCIVDLMQIGLVDLEGSCSLCLH